MSPTFLSSLVIGWLSSISLVPDPRNPRAILLIWPIVGSVESYSTYALLPQGVAVPLLPPGLVEKDTNSMNEPSGWYFLLHKALTARKSPQQFAHDIDVVSTASVLEPKSSPHSQSTALMCSWADGDAIPSVGKTAERGSGRPTGCSPQSGTSVTVLLFNARKWSELWPGYDRKLCVKEEVSITMLPPGSLTKKTGAIS